MSDGIYINGRRPASKKAVKQAVATAPQTVAIECTSMFGGYDGLVSDMPENKRIDFVGPDPYRDRRFYGSIVRTGAKIVVK